MLKYSLAPIIRLIAASTKATEPVRRVVSQCSRVSLLASLFLTSTAVGLCQAVPQPPLPPHAKLPPVNEPPLPANAFTGTLAGAQDKGLPLPESYGTPGEKDASALQEIVAHLSAVGSIFQLHLLANGTVTTPSSTASQAATLWLSPEGLTRLDYGSGSTLQSVRYGPGYGARQYGDKPIQLHPLTAATVGFLPFLRFRDPAFPASDMGLYDRGSATVDGSPLHRVTLALPLSPGTAVTPTAGMYTYVDYYFDPSTHLLVKSATRAMGDMHTFVRQPAVTTYADYRAYAGMMLPFRISEAFAGQVIWTLQINEYQLDPSFSTAAFHF